tara:strand:+ start:202 stop:615 length:414 start_codon:yes stop_codon:yes gene_type:complete
MRLTNICYKDTHQLESAENIDINSLDSIPNFSNNNMYLAILNMFPKTDSLNIINIAVNKLKQSGTLTLKLLNFNHIIDSYKFQKISDDDVCKSMHGVTCIINQPEIFEMFHNKPDVKIIDVSSDDIHSLYKIQRISL